MILIATTDMFFIAKIESVANIVGARVHFVKSTDELLAKAKIEAVSKIIIDLGSKDFDPIEAIERIRTDPGLAPARVIGYLSHTEMGELGAAARGAGCDVVLPKSAFSENLPEILR
jgi:CheY-like chemotaxis protein